MILKRTFVYHVSNIVILFFLFIALSSSAYSEKKTAPNPLGVGSNWKAEVKKGDKVLGPRDMDDQTRSFVQAVSDYFNAVNHMQGDFLQTSPENKKVKGRFYVKRPGKMRFDYAPPSKLRIVSDGRWLSIEDHDLKTIDRYPVSSTPFKLLLSKEVNLLKDAKIIDISKGETVAIISVQDKEDDSAGQLKLFFSLPELELKQWIITDPQGLDTRVEISNLVIGKKKQDRFFDVSDEDAFSFSD